ncbi:MULTISPECIES: protein-tyrosine phosphatase family protein [unclassified Frankia]|uniref:protein-tyrosine phosphatase family protein n=1 Tax=unclassified Frankia TaxID=2632575 RepID=UPI002024D1C9
MSGQLTGAIALPDGTMVRGRGRREPLPSGPLPTYGLYLASRHRLPRPHGPRWHPGWPAGWIDWPDFRAPRDDGTAAAMICHAYLLAHGGQRVEVACGGGTGRTGTVLACMAVLAGHPAADAVGWARRHYRPRAVETPGQRRWIRWFAAHHPEIQTSRDPGGNR